MGLDLQLLPFLNCDYPASHTVLPVFRRRDLFEAIGFDGTIVPAHFTCYLARGADGEACYGKCTVDQYGKPLRWVTAGHLCTFAGHVDVNDNADNRATWAYLAALEPGHRVALFWT